ncbi:MAG: acyltransferase [Phocaeicola sp.]|nr:acyltransferase [Phocaeicola sp.]MDD7448590.1 acyltransferase [Prevotellaceae bacterium]MDY5939768.1 acyltransferase [Phocaeicola sp.]
MNKEEAQRQSIVINSLRFPATVLMIASHCVITLKTETIPHTFSIDNIFLMLEHLCLSFGPISVSVFALITGYFFFFKTQSYSLHTYKNDLSKRIKTLLIPYLLWNIIALVLLYGKNYIGSKIHLSFAYNEHEMAFVTGHNFFEHMILPVNGPLWYVRECIYFTVLSPIVYFFVHKKTLGKLFLLLLFLVSYFFVFRVAHFTCFFALGAYLGLHKESILDFAKKIRIWGYALGWIYPYLRIFYGSEEWAENLRIYTLFFCIIAIINIGSFIYDKQKNLSIYLASFAPSVFFVYSLHMVLIVNLVRGTLYAILPWDNTIEKIVALLATTIIVPILCYYIYRAVARLFPRLSTILSGGRG